METIQIDILNPKAKKLLRNLADLNLIKITKSKKESNFSALLQELRVQKSENISLAEITNEVEQVRKSRYEK